jgi:hypothetical protein
MYILPTQEQFRDWKPARTLTIWTSIEPSKLGIADWIGEYPKDAHLASVHPVFYLHTLVAATVSDIDDNVHVVQQVLNGKYEYPLLDFLYFSAVTITTVGYGDILPNSTRVRTLVMLESLLGLVCMGAIASTLFASRGSG